MLNYPIWIWRPDAEMTESLEWMTDIIEAYDGTEQRIQVRQIPRQSFDVTVLVRDPILRSRLRVLLASWQHRTWGWPCWHEEAPLTSSASLGASSVNVSTLTGDWRVGSHALIWDSPSKYQVMEISGITGTALSFTTTLTAAYSAASCVFPLRTALLSEQVKREDYVGNELEYSLSVSVLDGAILPSSPSAVQYLGYDVLTDPLILSGSTVSREISRPIEVLDPGMGTWDQMSRTAFPSIGTERRWPLKTAAQCWAFRSWLHRRAGALRPICVPSYTHDLALAVTPGASATTLYIHDVGYRTLGLNVVGMTHIAVFSASGSFVCRQITNAVVGSAGQENLTINTPLGFADAVRVSFLSLNRFSADKISLKWERVGAAMCNATMVSVAI